MTRIFLSIAVCVSLALPAFAQSTREERLAIAQEYIEASLADMDTARLLQSMYAPIIAQIEASGQTVTDDQRARVHALYERELLQPLMDIMAAQSDTMADLFTIEEITALRDFYNTSIGRSVMSKLPLVIETQQPQIMATVQGVFPRLIPELQAILQN